jgi:CxxC motif-containing protein (DUF1111 family)
VKLVPSPEQTRLDPPPAQVCRRATMFVAALIFASACGGEPVLAVDPVLPAGAEVGEDLLGGDTTVFDTTRDAFARPARNLSDEHRDEFSLGDHFFNRNWITAPASVAGDDGLGPVYNDTSCSACHFKDGRAAPPGGPGEDWIGLVMRLSVTGTDEHGGPLPEPNYGFQFNNHSILDVPAEGQPRVEYEEVPGTYYDGEPYSLRRPTYALTNLAIGPLSPDLHTAPRIARAIIGLGLLEAIDDATVLALADENDADGNGISGRPNFVWDRRSGQTVRGKFGWKANRSTVEEQVGGAFLEDIGITSALFPDENCMPSQTACVAAPNGGTPELSDDKLYWITRYAETLAVPARRNWTNPTVLRGKALFHKAGCIGCHVPDLVTGTKEGLPELSNQKIHPYTDLLLHDMGPGLATDRPEYLAEGSEWRTPPLWGIGLVQTVNKHNYLLHDGRARGFAEAILWHDGEAIVPREGFRRMSKDDRDALLQFLESL